MKNTEIPRIIFIGGSNLSFGLNSQLIKDSLELNPINTGILEYIGLIYLMHNTAQYIKKGDLIILIPEYSNFYDDNAYGKEELLRTIFDVDIRKIGLLEIKQLINILHFIPKYSLSKYKPTEYIHCKESDLYGANSFNKYGDVNIHWNLGREVFKPSGAIHGIFNHSVLEKMKEFQTKIEKKKATLFVSYPGYQDLSYFNSIQQIKKVEAEYKKNGFRIIGNPERYMIPDSLMFNTPYHLNKKGVDYRTELFIEDFKKARMYN